MAEHERARLIDDLVLMPRAVKDSGLENQHPYPALKKGIWWLEMHLLEAIFFCSSCFSSQALSCSGRWDTITRMKLCSLKPPQHHIAPSIQRTGRSFLPPLGTFGDGSDWIFVVPAWRVEGMMTFDPRTALTEMAMEKRDGRAA